MNIFTYGSLMFGEVWQPLAARACASMKAELAGYVREGVIGEAYPGLRSETGAVTFGRVYLDVDADTLSRLDAFEGADYRRTRVVVGLRDQRGRQVDIEAEAYVFVDPTRLDGQPWDPDRFERDDAAGFYRAHARKGSGGLGHA